LTNPRGRTIVTLGNRIMKSRPKHLRPLLRSIAAVTLLFWIGAVTLCSAHCALGVGHGDSDDDSCHGSAVSQPHQDDHDSPTPAHHDSSAATCLALKSALSNGNAPAYIYPDFSMLQTLAPLVIALDSTTTEPATLFFRQARPGEWVFTPEVFLGPAFRSLAPPNSSLT
jgi:hypothetical protein